jgi:hypothetical protein
MSLSNERMSKVEVDLAKIGEANDNLRDLVNLQISEVRANRDMYHAMNKETHNRLSINDLTVNTMQGEMASMNKSIVALAEQFGNALEDIKEVIKSNTTAFQSFTETYARERAEKTGAYKLLCGIGKFLSWLCGLGVIATAIAAAFEVLKGFLKAKGNL